jgi:hypothetical protein
MKYGLFVEASGEFARQITFLSRAVCKDGSRHWMRHICIEQSEINHNRFLGVATDGKRLHLVDPLACPGNIGITEGNWRPLKMGGKHSWIAQILSDCGKFPNYRDVMPQGEPLCTFELAGIPRGNIMGNMSHLIKFFRKFPEPTAINLNYLNSLDPDRVWTVRWYGSDKAVSFESTGNIALIMTIRIE